MVAGNVEGDAEKTGISYIYKKKQYMYIKEKVIKGKSWGVEWKLL